MIKNIEKEVEQITKWIKEYVELSHSKGVVVGNSGGKDSATVIALATKALGKENITDDIISKISLTTTDDEKATMFVDAKYATAWIYDIIKEICGGAK